jgi:hypothetical protein
MAPIHPIRNAFYYRQHMYTLVPRYVREDMARLVDLGATALSIGLLEQDLYASIRNVETICAAAEHAGLDVYAVPSRWGGMVAGSMKVPSQFTVTHPETWVLGSDGRPIYTPVTGPVSSIQHPATFAFFTETLAELLDRFRFTGIIWDEVKVFDLPDYRYRPEQKDHQAWLAEHRRNVADFFGRLNRRIKQHNPSLLTAMFLYADAPEANIQAAADTDQLDYFGCDGKASRPDDPGRQEHAGKTLLGPGRRFLSAARDRGLGTLMLIENHNTDLEGMATLDRRLGETLQLDVDHWIFYYYGRNCDDPDGVMEVLSRHLGNRFGLQDRLS